MVLDKLLPDTQYTVTVVPIYAEGDGPSLTDNGKTSKWLRGLQGPGGTRGAVSP